MVEQVQIVGRPYTRSASGLTACKKAYPLRTIQSLYNKDIPAEHDLHFGEGPIHRKSFQIMVPIGGRGEQGHIQESEEDYSWSI